MLGERIKALRIEKGLMQQDLADELSVAKSTVGMWETNKREPDIETIKRIAAVFDYPVAFLLNDTVKIGREFDSSEQPDHCCPICGYNYIHLEDATMVDFYQSSKSSGFALKFKCEAEHTFYIVAENYKGCNYMAYTDENFHVIKPAKVETVVSAFESKYNLLDDYGKKAVHDLLNTEYERCAQQANATPNITTIKIHQKKAAAGLGYELDNEDEWEDIDVLDTEQVRHADFAVQVEGESMLPDYQNGDVVLVVRDSEVPVGKVGLFVGEDGGYIKERGKDCLISRNTAHPNIYGEVKCVGRVIGIATVV